MPPGQTSTEVVALPRRASNAVLDPIGTPDTPLALREAADQASFKGQVEKHAEMQAWTAALKRLIAHFPTRLTAATPILVEGTPILVEETRRKSPRRTKQRPPPGIGHNQPDPITHDDVLILDKAIIVLEPQPVVPKAPDDVRAVQSTLQKIAGRLGAYLDTFFLEASKSAGKEFIKQLARAPYWLAVWYVLQKLDQALTGWLH
jgi:hypothetical protein